MSKELEAAVLGAILDAEGPVLKSNPGALIDSAGLRATDFTEPRIRVAWGIAARLAERRRPVDAVTIFAAARSAGQLGDPDLTWLKTLQVSNALDRERFVVVVDQLRRSARGSDLAKSLTEAIDSLRRKGDVYNVASALEEVCRAAAMDHSQDETGDQDALEVGAEWEGGGDRVGSPLIVPTGVRIIDEHIGGFVPNLNVIAGLPSAGKSALAATMIEQQLRMGMRVGIFGLEDGTRWLARRLISKGLNIPVRLVGVQKIEGDLAERYPTVMQDVTNLLRGLTTYRHDTITVDEMCRRASHWVQNKGVQCIYLDHGGEVEHDLGKFNGEMRLAVGETYKRMRNTAIRYQVPFVTLAHTTRDSDNEEVAPRARDLAESAYIERRSRKMLGCWRRMASPDEMRVTVLKDTEGRSGQTLVLKRITQSALIDPNEGEEISLEQERREEAKKKKLDRVQESADAKEAKEALEADMRAKKKKRAPQGDLLEGVKNGAA